jgi:hypothetical protein
MIESAENETGQEQKLIVTSFSLSGNYPSLMETEGSLPSSQKPAEFSSQN